MDTKKLELLSAALRTLGGNFDVPTLEMIFSLKEEIDAKGEAISIGEVRAVSQKIAEKYQDNNLNTRAVNLENNT
ncbi:hypothetical protein K1F50_06835 [Muricauda oceani]|uniref:Uncharacterized protein n=1 Tax=Flagellimonas oceani TaxID=2698672 RepID=A0A6G7J757_9FLAO|nr:hypothetical protein [Allomuricauda oceani]MBW8242512.1 hypothetical protein [Allomuricauda oceani]QII46272.1 hypothetical protein GVT53_16820 [Allomuricauda oceani]